MQRIGDVVLFVFSLFLSPVRTLADNPSAAKALPATTRSRMR